MRLDELRIRVPEEFPQESYVFWGYLEAPRKQVWGEGGPEQVEHRLHLHVPRVPLSLLSFATVLLRKTPVKKVYFALSFYDFILLFYYFILSVPKLLSLYPFFEEQAETWVWGIKTIGF